ncbi:hypothetical protein [Desulfoluna spongiiphila]|uniref:hypothetical protein n=1 Tax=Desulfoluna spongiiphila TaxID=419481 RepID=UPI001252FABF|nr:hypothetical protein [Desulfoluna spongiiphila]VVS94255.1 hypothetical protein DBB_38270 [Desulfoluna spongiiphila]
MTLEEFKQIDWFFDLCGVTESRDEQSFGSHEALTSMLNDDPDSFFEPVYASPYEAWCVKDHEAAEEIVGAVKDDIEDWAEEVYLTLFERVPSAELCALVYDEVVTIASLMSAKEGAVGAFLESKIAIYSKGRIPWGYKGIFPDGVWILI